MHNSTHSDIENINFLWTLETRIPNVETQECGWSFQRINSMKI